MLVNRRRSACLCRALHVEPVCWSLPQTPASTGKAGRIRLGQLTGPPLVPPSVPSASRQKIAWQRSLTLSTPRVGAGGGGGGLRQSPRPHQKLPQALPALHQDTRLQSGSSCPLCPPPVLNVTLTRCSAVSSAPVALCHDEHREPGPLTQVTLNATAAPRPAAGARACSAMVYFSPQSRPRHQALPSSDAHLPAATRGAAGIAMGTLPDSVTEPFSEGDVTTLSADVAFLPAQAPLRHVTVYCPAPEEALATAQRLREPFVTEAMYWALGLTVACRHTPLRSPHSAGTCGSWARAAAAGGSCARLTPTAASASAKACARGRAPVITWRDDSSVHACVM